MINKYVSFVSDEHFLKCIENLHNSYERAKSNISLKSLYKNKVDTIKLTFDSLFNEIGEEDLLKNEILRQIDKSINNSIGTFHEQILGGIKGYEVGNLSGYDIKATDNSLFADIKNKHNTMNSSSAEALFQKLARYADDNKKAKCYWVQILAKNSFVENWKGDINGKEYSHSRVFKISGDKFYASLTGEEDAFFQIYKALPIAIHDYLKSKGKNSTTGGGSAIDEINEAATIAKRSLLDQITFDNFKFYKGFEDL